MFYHAFFAIFIRSIYTKHAINPHSRHILYHIRHPDKHRDIWRLVNVIGDLACYLHRYAIILNLVINMDWHYCTDLFFTICSLIITASPHFTPGTSAACAGWCSLLWPQQDGRTISQLDTPKWRENSSNSSLQRAIKVKYIYIFNTDQVEGGREETPCHWCLSSAWAQISWNTV